MRIRSSLITLSLVTTLAAPGRATAEPPAAAKPMKPTAVYKIDDLEVPRAVYEAFRSSLQLHKGGVLVDKTHAVYVIEEQGDQHVVRHQAPAKPRPSTRQYFIDRLPVPELVYNAFRETLKEEKGTWFCAEMTDGGSTGMHATASDGTRYAIRETSSTKRGARYSITRLDAPAP
jgi:hypothetical protein